MTFLLNNYQWRLNLAMPFYDNTMTDESSMSVLDNSENQTSY